MSLFFDDLRSLNQKIITRKHFTMWQINSKILIARLRVRSDEEFGIIKRFSTITDTYFEILGK
jgi:hypothetical protein